VSSSLILSVADISTLYNRLMNISPTKFISGCDEDGDKGSRHGVLERSHKRFVNVEPRSVIGLIRIYGREQTPAFKCA